LIIYVGLHWIDYFIFLLTRGRMLSQGESDGHGAKQIAYRFLVGKAEGKETTKKT
jgi:hypothetical protein